jgi:HK97 family phage prohead protease
MVKIINKSFEAELKELSENGSTVICGYANVSQKDRSGEVILKDAWNLKNYSNNPIVLFNHDKSKIIGRATICEVREKGLYVELEIAKRIEGMDITDSQKEAEILVKQGYLKTFSVGFIPHEAEYDKKTEAYHITEAELLEVSLVSIPCQQDSVVEYIKELVITNNKGEKQMALEQADLDSIKALVDASVAPIMEKVAAIFDKLMGSPDVPEMEEGCKPEDVKVLKEYISKLEEAVVELTK